MTIQEVGTLQVDNDTPLHELTRLCVVCGLNKTPSEFKYKTGKQCLKCEQAKVVVLTQTAKRRRLETGIYVFRTEKKCPTCDTIKPLSAFHKASSEPDGTFFQCKECRREPARVYQKQWLEDHPNYHRPMNLRRLYKLTESDYDALLLVQGGVCAICKRHPEDGKFLCVDHDQRRSPGRKVKDRSHVRGLLCHSCNTAVGLFGDSITACRLAADYLEKYEMIHPQDRNNGDG